MNKKHIIIIIIVILLSVIIGTSYAYFMANYVQDGVNAYTSDCFKIEFQDENDINLSSAVPISEAKANSLTPYTFSITNVCNSTMDFSVNIETLNNTTMDLNAVRYKLNNNNSKILGSILDNSSSSFVNQNVLSSKTIGLGIIKAGVTKNYNLRLWIDKDANISQTANKTLDTKVVVTSILHNPNVTKLIAGKEFNKAIRSLSSSDEVDGEISNYNDMIEYYEQEKQDLDERKNNEYDSMSEEEKSEFDEEYNEIVSYYNSLLNADVDLYRHNNSIKKILFSNVAPEDGVETKVVSTNDSNNLVLAWFEDGNINLYTEANEVYFNEDSSYMFANLMTLEDIDFSKFNSFNLINMSYMFSLFNYLEYIEEDGTMGAYHLENDEVSPCLTNLDLSIFDTSNVIDMTGTFMGLTNLTNLNLKNLDTSNVEKMSFMFEEMHSLTSLDLSSFNTFNVIDMRNMFSDMNNLNSLDLSSFDTSNVTNMSFMFYGMKNLTNLNINSFNTVKVTDMSHMFEYLPKLNTVDVSSFDTSNVINMEAMFLGGYPLQTASGALSSIIGVENFNTSNVINMNGMFKYLTKLTQLDLSDWDTSKVEDMGSMFSDTTSLTNLNFEGWDTSNVEDMSYMFNNSSLDNLNFDGWNTSKVKDMSRMFYGMNKITSLDLSHFDTSNVVKMEHMFSYMDNIEALDISSFNTSKVIDMSEMFYSDSNLVTIYVGNDWIINDGCFTIDMTKFLNSIVGGKGTTYNTQKYDKEYACIDDPDNGKPGYFTLKTN